MVPDGRTDRRMDGKDGRTDGRTHGRRQNYIPSTSSGDNNNTTMNISNMGAQWLSGRVLDSRKKGRGFEPHWRHCIVVLEQDTFILA